MGMCSPQLLCPGSSPPNSNRFGLLMAPRSRLPSENERSQPSCHPTELQSSFSSHRSIRRDSIHHETKNCQWYMLVQIPECPTFDLISSFQDLRDHFSMFCPCASLWHLGSPRWFLWTIPLDFTFFSLLFPLPSLLDHDLLCLPLSNDCLPVLLRALQSH